MQPATKISIASGTLDISMQDSAYTLETLLDFGARQNPKRGYLFLSKILGKYIPCKPCDMRQSYRDLAALVSKDIYSHLQNPWVMGIAETATGLGAGFAQEIQKNTQSKTIFSHTTRHAIDAHESLRISETHSHAPSHIVYQMRGGIDRKQCNTLFLVDDEISTGNTLFQLTEGVTRKNPAITQVVWVSLVNWLSPERKREIQYKLKNLNISFISLAAGQYTFTDNAQFSRKLPKGTAVDICQHDSRSDIGRTGCYIKNLKQPVFVAPDGRHIDASFFKKDEGYCIAGTGEFTHLPFVFAEHLDSKGVNVVFQSTGRSPISESDGIKSKESFISPQHNGLIYLYNRPRNRKLIILYENNAHFRSCPLPDMLGAEVGILVEG